MSILFCFPGQGSQIVGMGYDLYQNFQVAKHIFQEVDDALNENLSKLIFEGDKARALTHGMYKGKIASVIQIVHNKVSFKRPRDKKSRPSWRLSHNLLKLNKENNCTKIMAIDTKIRQIIKDLGLIKIDNMMRDVSSIIPSSYYRSKTSIGADGDFITAPEISQLFGETIGFWAINKWQQLGCPKKFALVEFGPGLGILMRDLMRVAKLVPEFTKAVKIFLYEINKNFIKQQKTNLSFTSSRVTWINNINELPPIPCIIISNEFFDALPIKQYIKIRKTWYESVIICDPIDNRLKFDKKRENFLLLYK